MMRFMPATPPLPSFYASRVGHEIILDAGVENIRAKSLRQTQLIIDHCKELGLEIITPLIEKQRGGMVCFKTGNDQLIHKQLSAKGFVFDSRPKAGIRISPHFYTTDDELDEFFKELKRVIH